MKSMNGGAVKAMLQGESIVKIDQARFWAVSFVVVGVVCLLFSLPFLLTDSWKGMIYSVFLWRFGVGCLILGVLWAIELRYECLKQKMLGE